jgi:hypothetical protein
MKNNNKLFAEFMGYELRNNLYCFFTPPEFDIWNKHSEEDRKSIESIFYNFEEDELEYHSSWDWLMPVVEKIRTTAGCLINSDSQEKKYAFMLFSLSVTTPIETVYLYVSNYIEWYNSVYKK